tara:strand:- start:34 stop:2274 length:2241 start_codon:yes stop_codon:yes gene_type:complete
MNEEEDIRGGATDEQINQAYKERLILDQQDPRTDEKFLEERAKQKQAEEEDTTTDKLESRGYKGNRKSIRQRQKEARERALDKRDKEGSTVTRSPGQVFTRGKDTIEVPDRDMRTGQLIPNETELDQFGNPLLAAGFEITANTILDLFTPILPLQSGGSYVINLISQIIRDPSKIGSLNQLEAGAAAASSLIPGANQYSTFLKSVKPATRGTQLARQVGRGAVDANIQLAGMKLGEGEEITLEDIQAATLFGGGLGGIIGTTPEIFKGGGDLPKVFRNIRRRIDGTLPGNERITPEGFNLGKAEPEFEPTTAFAMGGPGSGRRKKVDTKALEAAGQGNIFKSFADDPRLGQTDDQIMEAYKAARLRLGDPYSEPRQLPRSAAERRLVPSMFTKFLTEDPSIPQSKVQEYIDAVTDERRGRKLYNLVAGKPFARKRSNKGLTGTLIFLNDAYLSGRSGVKKLGNVTMNDLTPIRARTGSPQDIADEMSAIFGRDITPDTLEDIINKQGSIPIEIGTPGTANYEVIDVVDLPTLTEAYMKRIQRYRTIPAFEAGHIFAARNILDDLDVDDVANFKGNLEPEIARSIYGITDNKVFEDLLEGVDTEKIVAGNRARGQNIDPDKTIAALYGRDYGLRESFLNFVYPERSLANKIPPDLKKEFTERYVEEMNIALRDYDGGTVGPHTLDFIRAIVLKEKVMPFFDLGDEFLEGFINTANKVTKADMVSDINVYLERNLLKPLQINVAGEAK